MSIEFVKAPIQNKCKEVTPTTEDIRYSYVEGPWGEGGEQAFNNWLAEELRKAKSDAWHEGFEAGWEEQENPGPFVNDIWDAKTPNPYRSQQ